MQDNIFLQIPQKRWLEASILHGYLTLIYKRFPISKADLRSRKERPEMLKHKLHWISKYMIKFWHSENTLFQGYNIRFIPTV